MAQMIKAMSEDRSVALLSWAIDCFLVAAGLTALQSLRASSERSPRLLVVASAQRYRYGPKSNDSQAPQVHPTRLQVAQRETNSTVQYKTKLQ